MLKVSWSSNVPTAVHESDVFGRCRQSLGPLWVVAVENITQAKSRKYLQFFEMAPWRQLQGDWSRWFQWFQDDFKYIQNVHIWDRILSEKFVLSQQISTNDNKWHPNQAERWTQSLCSVASPGALLSSQVLQCLWMLVKESEVRRQLRHLHTLTICYIIINILTQSSQYARICRFQIPPSCWSICFSAMTTI